MRQVISSGLGIGFFTPIGFIDEIAAASWCTCRWPSLGSQSRIGILVPRYRRLSRRARLTVNHITERLRAFARFLGAAAASAERRCRTDMATVLTGGIVLTVDAARILPSADIRIDGDVIAALGPAGAWRNPATP